MFDRCVLVAHQSKLSRLCEQDKAVRMQEDKLQQLHREKVSAGGGGVGGSPLRISAQRVSRRLQHTLETALLAASQELSEQSGSNAAIAAVQNLIQQRDVLQSGLLSTCRELSRVSAVSRPRPPTPRIRRLRSQSRDLGAGRLSLQELERSWREYDRLGAEVTLAKSNLLEQLEALGSPQVRKPPLAGCRRLLNLCPHWSKEP